MRRESLIQLEGWASIIVNTALFILKLWAGLVSGSIAIIADAWHTLSDSVSSVVIILGTRFSMKKADDNHPFGHGRAENIATLVISILLFFVAFSFVKESILRVIHSQKADFGKIAIIVTIISIVIKELSAQFALWAARKTNAKILKADAWHHRSDALSSVVILAGIYLSGKFFWADGVLGVIVGILIFHTAYEIFKDSINPLLGVPVTIEVLDKVRAICKDISGEDCQPHHFHLHEYGCHQELTFHVKLPPTESLQEAHDMVTIIEKEIEKQLKMEVTIHMEPLG